MRFHFLVFTFLIKVKAITATMLIGNVPQGNGELLDSGCGLVHSYYQPFQQPELAELTVLRYFLHVLLNHW